MDTLDDVIMEIWRRVLAVPLLAPDDDFIDMGGDSISAVQIVDQVRRRLGPQLPSEAVLDHPTVRSFAALVASRMTAGAQESLAG